MITQTDGSRDGSMRLVASVISFLRQHVNELFESLIGSSTPLGIGIEFHQEPVNSVEEALCQSADLDHHEPRFRRTEDYLPPIANEVQNLPALAGPAFARFCTVGVDERATRSV